MAYRVITGQYKRFYNDLPYDYGIVKFRLTKTDYDTSATYVTEEIEVVLDQDGRLPVGFALWCNVPSETTSFYVVTDPDNQSWSFVLPEGGSPIDIEDLRS